MTRLTEIEAHIASMSELLEVVSAMRSLAGMRMQEAQRTLPGIRRYVDAIAAGIADTIALMEEPARPAEAQGRLALVLCAAEHGFVGGFNERLLEAVQTTVRPGDLLFVLGTRGATLAAERGVRVAWMHPMATRSAAAPDAAQRLAAELYQRIALGEVARVEALYARYRQGAASNIERRLLLPLDLALLRAKQPRQPPLHNLDPGSLHERLMTEHVFALLTDAVVESIASENAARLAAMESAHDNVLRKLTNLRRGARQARQSEITTELLECVSAVKVLGDSR